VSSLKEYIKDGVNYGSYLETQSSYYFFGNKNFTEEHFSFFAGIDFVLLKQTHSDVSFSQTLADAKNKTNSRKIGDAQFTNDKRLAMVVQTADCLPILGSDGKTAIAIHAGWRGIANYVTTKTLLHAQEDNNLEKPLFIIGPHILQKSFEVDEDAASLLKAVCMPAPKCAVDASIEYDSDYFFYDEQKKKYFFDLQKIAETQISSVMRSPFTLEKSSTDTFTDSNYSSFRRLKSPCRNWSFVYLK